MLTPATNREIEKAGTADNGSQIHLAGAHRGSGGCVQIGEAGRKAAKRGTLKSGKKRGEWRAKPLPEPWLADKELKEDLPVPYVLFCGENCIRLLVENQTKDLGDLAAGLDAPRLRD